MASLNSLNSMKFMIVLLDAVPQIHLDNSLGQIAYNTGRFWRKETGLIFILVVFL